MTNKTSNQRAAIVHQIENVLPTRLNRLVQRVKPWNPANSKQPTGWNFHMYTRPCMVQYPANGEFRQKSSRVGRAAVMGRVTVESVDQHEPGRGTILGLKPGRG